ncbi:MlaD family protein [Actinomadura atramentaria]|uniref:MlaD family protein n=1 Tax=Actinomadura atramentaria TaxID=1990 RepID=UPI00037C9606|nr:MlaD family protein [Actinomadura atramentaria]
MTDSALSARARVKFGAIGVAVLAGAVALVGLGARSPDGGDTEYTAAFGRAGQGLDERSDVKVRGMTVGRVASVSLRADGRVLVRMKVRRDVRVPREAQARVDPVSVFGPKEISLDLGDQAGPYLASGGAITRTVDPSDPSDTAWPAYRAASAVDPQDVATLAHTFGRGLAGSGPALRRGLDNGASVIDAMYGDRTTLRDLVRDVTGVSTALGGRGDAIVGATRDLNGLAPLADDRLAALLDESARLSERVGGTLQAQGGALGGIIDQGGRAASVVNAAGPDLMELIDGLNGFFTGIADVIDTDGPQGARPAMLRVPLTPDVCAIIIDLCPTRGPSTP